MLRSAVGKVTWMVRATTTVVGLAIMLALLFGVASTALAHKADRGLFHLGHTNAGKALSTLVGTLTTPVLKLDNNGTGPALQLEAGTAAGAEPGTVAPISVNPEAGTATGLSADELDGKDSSQFAGATHPHSGADITSGTVAEGRIDGSIARDSEVMPTVKANDGSGSGVDADTLDGQNSSSFLGANQKATDSDKLDGKDSSAFGIRTVHNWAHAHDCDTPNTMNECAPVTVTVPANKTY